MRDLRKAELEEFPLDNKARYAEKASDPSSLFYWQQQAKTRGLKGTMGKSRDELKAMVEEHDELAKSNQAVAGDDAT